MKNYNDNNLKEALHLYAEKMDKEFPTDEEVADVKFSADFEQSMDNIVQRRKRPFLRIFNSTAKRVASVAAVFVLLISVTFSVSAIREPVLEMFQKIFNNHVEIKIEGDITEYIAKIYAITEIPEGYTMTDEMISTSMVNRDYDNEDGLSFSYTQISTANDPMVDIDNEHSKHYKKKVDELELYIADFEEDNIKLVYWVQDGYLFHLTFYSRPTDDEIIPIIKSNTIVGYQENE